ncbi:PREDICTED: low molecular weight phosphotyrosine protein phosphatase-like isoform X1 [Branchiostoma belcheri]|uniref:Low molecular weight phosphotyrosine protein phosphatase n=1 Tax=Branchiostoma belcheri TaxID=7741 RepID=A0A6P5A5Y2_BRABE|nr:PREDICTED: low molecular weight phosphotyrosine protein phosphatase-like isoform X1 [Branchiostoma belcheri]
MAAKSGKKSVLFVCLGNICRSPIAEAVFTHLVREKGQLEQWTVDSAGTHDWNVGLPPDERGQACMRKHGVYKEQIARQVTEEDFTKFQYILGMDHNNISNLKNIQPPKSTATVKLLGSFDPEGQEVIEDPYYGEESDFERVYQQCVRCCKAFLDTV